MEALSFKLEVFEGPLELLLHLIQKNKVSIYDIPIALITEQYLDYLSKMEQMDLEISSSFLVMAAKLLYIKSKMLLPKHEEEEEQEEDPRQELILSLAEYKRYKEISHFFVNRKGVLDYLYFKHPQDLDGYKLIQKDQIPVDRLTEAFSRVMERFENRQPPSKQLFSGIVGREPVSVKSKVTALKKRFANKNQLSFDTLFYDAASRSEIVAIFLAILEMVRNNDITVQYTEDEVLLNSVENGEAVG